jgi:hypothetical protein
MTKEDQTPITPPFDDEDQEKKLIALAYRQAESELKEGTASSQIVTHFLRLGTQRAELEQAQIELQNSLLQEKIIGEREGQKLTEMVDDVLRALRSYMYVPPGDVDDNIL